MVATIFVRRPACPHATLAAGADAALVRQSRHRVGDRGVEPAVHPTLAAAPCAPPARGRHRRQRLRHGGADVGRPRGRARRRRTPSATRSRPCGVPYSARTIASSTDSGLREEGEDAPAVVVDDDDHEVDAPLGGTEQAVGVVQEREVADQQRGRARRSARATPTAVETTPSIPLAPRLAWTSSGTSGCDVPLEVPDRHRRRHDQPGAVRQRVDERPCRARLGRPGARRRGRRRWPPARSRRPLPAPPPAPPPPAQPASSSAHTASSGRRSTARTTAAVPWGSTTRPLPRPRSRGAPVAATHSPDDARGQRAPEVQRRPRGWRSSVAARRAGRRRPRGSSRPGRPTPAPAARPARASRARRRCAWRARPGPDPGPATMTPRRPAKSSARLITGSIGAGMRGATPSRRPRPAGPAGAHRPCRSAARGTPG